MSAKKLTSRFEVNDKETSLVQGKIEKALRHKASEQMEKDRRLGVRINWDILIEEAVKVYLEERGVK
jgi:uncharacterized protein (UPF0297 family)